MAKSPSKRSLLAIGVGGVLIFVVSLFCLVLYGSIQSNVVPAEHVMISSPKEQDQAELPQQLKIPKLKIDTVIEQVGLTAEGDMDTPKGPNEVAWYKFGPRPGGKGNAVITGHFGLKNNVPGVFDNLDKLSAGDLIYVEDMKGVTISFVVSKIQKYGAEEDASVVFRSSDDEAHLNLITCDGVWNQAKKSYSHRLVVFADKQ